MPGFLQADAVQTVLFEKPPQGHFGDAEVPRTPDEVEQFVTRGPGMGKEKLGDGAGMAGQELPVRAAVEAMLNLVDHLPGGELPMAERRPAADTDQACDLSHLQTHIAAEQEKTSDSRTGIVPVARLKELKRCMEDGPLLIAQLFGRDLCPTQPLFADFRGLEFNENFWG